MVQTAARIVALASALCISAGPSFAAEPNREGLPTGWEWVFPPSPLGESFGRYPVSIAGADVLAVYLPGAGNDVAATLSTAAESGVTDAHETEYRAYLVAPDGNLIQGRGMSTSGNGKVTTHTSMFALEEDRFDRAELSMGVARLTLDGRIEASLEAMAEARAVGAKALPLPIIGKPYDFEMPTIDGGVIRSEDLRGKVVVVDSWATWCMPCMQKMPALKSLAESHPDDLVVIGVNFDENLEDAKAELAKGTVPGVQIHAESLAKGVEDLWYRATGIRSIPRIFVIDRDGILVHDLSPYQMEQRVEEVLASDAD